MTGFSPSEITIDIGEEIMWINDRKNVKAMVQGTREHRHIISTILDPGESFTYTPTIAGRYIFIDAVVTSHVLKVNVGEFADRNW
jgi:plastocyanin